MIDFTKFKLVDWFEEESMKEWARNTLPGIQCPPLSSKERSARMQELDVKSRRLIALLAEANLLLKDMTRECAALSPRRLLPVELVAPTLKACFTSANPDLKMEWPYCRISSICHPWRSEALRNPRCWSHMQFNIYPRWDKLGEIDEVTFSTMTMRLDTHLKMSKGAPQYIHLGLTDDLPREHQERISYVLKQNVDNCVSFTEERADIDTDDLPGLGSIIQSMHETAFFQNLRYLSLGRGVAIHGPELDFPMLHTLSFSYSNFEALLRFECPMMETLLLHIPDRERIVNPRLIISTLSNFSALRKLGLQIENYSDWYMKGTHSPSTLPPISSDLTEIAIQGPFEYTEESGKCWFPALASHITELSIREWSFMDVTTREEGNLTLPSVTTLRLMTPPDPRIMCSRESTIRFMEAFPNLERLVMLRNTHHLDDDNLMSWTKTPVSDRVANCTNLISVLLHENLSDRDPCAVLREIRIESWSLDVNELQNWIRDTSRCATLLQDRVRITTKRAQYQHCPSINGERAKCGEDLLPDISDLTLRDTKVAWRTWMRDSGLFQLSADCAQLLTWVESI